MICYICHIDPGVPHKHHPILQAAGGTDEGTIILCGSCHNSVHSEIDRLCAILRRGNGGSSGVNWKWCRHSQEVFNATAVITTGVQSVMTYEGDKKGKITITVSPDVHQILVAMKQRTGASSLPKVIVDCILYTARHSNLV